MILKLKIYIYAHIKILKGDIMDEFDSYYEKNVLKKNDGGSEKNELLEEKREEIYKFFSSTMTLIVVAALWASFIYGIYTSITSFSVAGGMIGTQVFSLLLTIALGIILPVGFYKVYNGSKKKDPDTVDTGFLWLITYFKIIKVILIVAAVASGILLLLSLLVAAIRVMVVILIVALVYWLAFYIIRLFRSFLDDLSLTFNSGKQPSVPLPSKIKTYLIVIFVITLIGSLIGIISFDSIGSIIPDTYGIDIQLMLDSIAVLFYVSIVIAIISQIYFLYYVSVFEKTFGTFNTYFRKKVKEAEEDTKNSDEV